MRVDSVFFMEDNRRVWIEVSSVSKLTGIDYFCPDGHPVTIVAEDSLLIRKHARHLPGCNCRLERPRSESSGESALHMTFKQAVADMIGGSVEATYPDSLFVADAGLPARAVFHEVVVHHDIDGKKAKYIQEGLYSGILKHVVRYNVKAYLKRRWGVSSLRSCTEKIIKLCNDAEQLKEMALAIGTPIPCYRREEEAREAIRLRRIEAIRLKRIEADSRAREANNKWLREQDNSRVQQPRAVAVQSERPSIFKGLIPAMPAASVAVVPAAQAAFLPPPKPKPASPKPARRCLSCRNRYTPGLSYPGYCGERKDQLPAYGEGHPLRKLPVDMGADCVLFAAVEDWCEVTA